MWNACVFYQSEFPFSSVVNSQSFLPLPLRLLDLPSYVLSFNSKLMNFWASTNFLRPNTRIWHYCLLENAPLFGHYSGGTCSYASYIIGCWDLKPWYIKIHHVLLGSKMFWLDVQYGNKLHIANIFLEMNYFVGEDSKCNMIISWSWIDQCSTLEQCRI